MNKAIEYIIDNKIYVHCHNDEQDKIFRKTIEHSGIKIMTDNDNYYMDYRIYPNKTAMAVMPKAYEKCWGLFFFLQQYYTAIHNGDLPLLTINDLRDGDCIENEDGDRYVYAGGYFVNKSAWMNPDYFNLSLGDDIILVKRPTDESKSINQVIEHGEVLFDKKVANKEIFFSAVQNPICLWDGMTIEEAHCKMWNDLADNKVKSPKEWLDIHNINNEEIPFNCCFACEATINDNGLINCDKCPLIVKNKKISNHHECLLRKWDDLIGFEKFKLAHEIANLPWDEADK